VSRKNLGDETTEAPKAMPAEKLVILERPTAKTADSKCPQC